MPTFQKTTPTFQYLFGKRGALKRFTTVEGPPLLIVAQALNTVYIMRLCSSTDSLLISSKEMLVALFSSICASLLRL